MPGLPGKRRNSVAQFGDVIRMAQSPEAINTHLGLFDHTTRYTAIRQLLVLSTEDIVTAIRERSERMFRHVEMVNAAANAFLARIPAVNAIKRISGEFAVLPTEHPSVYRIVTVSGSEFWERVIRRLAKRAYPSLLPLFVKQNEMHDALSLLEKSLGGKRIVRIVDATLKSSSGKRISGTERYWKELSIGESFEVAEERGLWFTSIKFEIRQRSGRTSRFKPVLSGRLYKRGEIHYEWLHEELSQYLVAPLESAVIDRLALLQKRGIKENNYRPGYPLEINYGQDIFSEVKEVRRFGKVISEYRNASKAVFHGNPYYHASVADFLDGSSFELWVLSPQRVIIVPQARSSPQALERLIAHISYEFREGKVNEYTGTT